MKRPAATCLSAILAGLLCLLPAATAQQPGDRVVRIAFVGDVCLDGGAGPRAHLGPGSAGRHRLDLARQRFGGGESQSALPIPHHGKEDAHGYTFKAPLEAVPLLKRYFAAVSLANNHAGDWGKEGFASQLELFQREKLPYFGGGHNRDEARRPLLVVSHGRRMALLACCDFPPRRFAAGEHECGTAWLVEEDLLADIRTARTRYHADTVIPFLHWGRESTPTPEDYQPKLARRLIDAGADAVVVAHPHVTQTVDWYRGKPIIYSLGNCVFNYFPHDPAIYYGWCVQLTFGRPEGIDLQTTVLKLDEAGLPHVATSADRCR